MTTSPTAPPGDDREATPHVVAQGRPLVPIRPPVVVLPAAPPPQPVPRPEDLHPPLAPHPRPPGASRPSRATGRPARRPRQHRSLPGPGPVVTVVVWLVAAALLLLLL